MEVLVVVAIFSTAMVALTDTFLIANRAEQKVLGREDLAAVARASMEQIARALRQGSVDYARYAGDAGGPLLPTDSRLFVRAGDGSTRSFTLSSSGCAASASPCLMVEENNMRAPLTPAGAVVDRFSVVVTPTVDPDVAVGGAYPSSYQPTVTVHMTLHSGSGSSAASVDVQTSVTTRRYVR